MSLLRRGLCGEPVRILQQQLGVNADGVFGAGTEQALIQYQNDNGLSPDGIAGPDTFTAMGLDELVLLERPIRGELVRRLQLGLELDADGVFGHGTEEAVKRVQEANGLDVTGKAGPETLRFVPGFEIPDDKVNASIVTEETPPVDTSALDQARTEDPPPPHENVVVHAVHAVEDTVEHIGQSIWSTVKSIF